MSGRVAGRMGMKAVALRMACLLLLGCGAEPGPTPEVTPGPAADPPALEIVAPGPAPAELPAPAEPAAPEPIRGEIVLSANTGADFASGDVAPGTFQWDLYATAGGRGLKLTPGGPTPVESQDVIWWKSGAGVLETYDSLDDVPFADPATSGDVSLPAAQPGVGFVLRNNTTEGVTRGWVREANESRVVIEYELLPAAEETDVHLAGATTAGRRQVPGV